MTSHGIAAKRYHNWCSSPFWTYFKPKRETLVDILFRSFTVAGSQAREEMAAIVPGILQLNNFSCNQRLARYVRAGQYEKILELFQQMQEDCMIPDRLTFVPGPNACANLQLLEDGRHVHKQIIESGCESDIFVGNSLIDMYAKCGCMEKA